MKKSTKRIAAAAAVILAVCLACGAYVGDCYRADEAAVEAMNASDLRVEAGNGMIAFIPEAPCAGFIFYPGGKVEYTAYAPLMRALAEKGVLCVLTEMPFNLAVLDINAAEGIPERYPDVEKWYIGGHSLGGSMAASHAAKHSDIYEGLVLLAAYSTADLTDTGLRVISIYGSEDGVLNMEKYKKYAGNLPAAHAEYVIDGGNHAGFGAYGPQEGDGNAAITAQEQIRQTAELLADAFA